MQILSIFTLHRLDQLFTKCKKIDLRILLDKDIGLLSSIIFRVEHCFGTFLNALRFVAAPEHFRTTVSQIILEHNNLEVR